MRSDFNIKNTITMSKVTSHMPGKQIRLHTPGHNLDSVKLVMVLGQLVCPQNNWTVVVFVGCCLATKSLTLNNIK